MEKEIPVLHNGKTVGRATVTREGLYHRVCCDCDAISTEVLRAYGSMDGQDLLLGVLMPQNGRLYLEKRVACSAFPMEQLATVTIGGAPGTWRPWCGDLGPLRVEEAQIRQYKGKTMLALPYHHGEPVPYFLVLRYCTPTELNGTTWMVLDIAQLPAEWALQTESA